MKGNHRASATLRTSVYRTPSIEESLWLDADYMYTFGKRWDREYMSQQPEGAGALAHYNP
jgi:hypothetical protein